MSEEETTTKTTTPEATTATTETTATTAAPATAPKKKKVKRTVATGQVHVLATFNNTIITITDAKGGALAQASAGGCGFRGSKKGTAYAAQVAAEKAINAAKQQYNLSKADVFIKGVGLGRESAVRALASAGIAVEIIKDVTGVPHGGCRPKKARRV
jgi:small subunit ribosomal protein S11